jgi:hypothetical protein
MQLSLIFCYFLLLGPNSLITSNLAHELHPVCLDTLHCFNYEHVLGVLGSLSRDMWHPRDRSVENLKSWQSMCEREVTDLLRKVPASINTDRPWYAITFTRQCYDADCAPSPSLFTQAQWNILYTSNNIYDVSSSRTPNSFAAGQISQPLMYPNGQCRAPNSLTTAVPLMGFRRPGAMEFSGLLQKNCKPAK